MPYLSDVNGNSYSNSYMYARNPSEQEIKKIMQNWRMLFYKTKVKPKIYQFYEKECFEFPF